jgi:stage V sporulation protein SpoVS
VSADLTYRNLAAALHLALERVEQLEQQVVALRKENEELELRAIGAAARAQDPDELAAAAHTLADATIDLELRAKSFGDLVAKRSTRRWSFLWRDADKARAAAVKVRELLTAARS